jgi:signal transduction histidine kinase
LFKFPAHSDYGLSEMRQTAYIAPLKRDDAVIGILCIVDDVSERVVREAELLAAREEATKANLAKDRFIAMLSHDLRTPLTAILGWARVFQERAVDERMVRKGAEAIQRNATLQLELIEEILDISRMTSGKLELALEPTNVWVAVDKTLEGLEPVARSNGVQLNRVLPTPEERIAQLDGKRFQQIIWNLISNAFKFTPRVVVST